MVTEFVTKQIDMDKEMNIRCSLSHQGLPQILEKLNKYEPRAIGLDIYRDISVDPKVDAFSSVLTRSRSRSAASAYP